MLTMLPLFAYVFCWPVDYDPWIECDITQDDWS